MFSSGWERSDKIDYYAARPVAAERRDDGPNGFVQKEALKAVGSEATED